MYIVQNLQNKTIFCDWGKTRNLRLFKDNYYKYYKLCFTFFFDIL